MGFILIPDKKNSDIREIAQFTQIFEVYRDSIQIYTELKYYCRCNYDWKGTNRLPSCPACGCAMDVTAVYHGVLGKVSNHLGKAMPKKYLRLQS